MNDPHAWHTSAAGTLGLRNTPMARAEYPLRRQKPSTSGQSPVTSAKYARSSI